MVFCGKPSKGCGECRSRKIRCDQVRPTCSQCAKGNRVCPGYRDELSLMFRDESQQVVLKAKTGSSSRKAKASKRKPRPSGSQGNSSPEVSVEMIKSPWPLTPPCDISDFNNLPEHRLRRVEQELLARKPPTGLQPSYQPTKDEAVMYFLRYNAWPGAIFMMDFDATSLARAGASMSQQAQLASLVSVGMAMLSRFRRSEELSTAAELEYGQALQLLTRAVCNEKESRANETLSAVLLLAIFEVVTSRTLKSIAQWTNHIYGAAALLEIRGTEELLDLEGLKLFIQLRFQIIISCLQRGAHVPPSLLECTKIAMFLRPGTDTYCDRLITIAGKLSNLRADINTKILRDPNQILSRATAIEAELLAWAAAAPADFVYTTVDCPSIELWTKIFLGKPLPYNDRYHLYRDLWVCHTWNQYRCARILVSEMILSSFRQISALSTTKDPSPEIQAHCAKVHRAMRELASDILASAAFHFDVEDPVTPEAAAWSIPASQSYVGGMLLLWPLVIAGATETKGHPVRKWVIDCLKLIGHSIGIDQALALIEVLEVESGVLDYVEETSSGIVFRNVPQTGRNQVLVGTRFD